jgi:hypothetical protein
MLRRGSRRRRLVCRTGMIRVLRALRTAWVAARIHVLPLMAPHVDVDAPGRAFSLGAADGIPSSATGRHCGTSTCMGSQKNDAGEDTHFHAYVTALRMSSR